MGKLFNFYLNLYWPIWKVKSKILIILINYKWKEKIIKNYQDLGKIKLLKIFNYVDIIMIFKDKVNE